MKILSHAFKFSNGKKKMKLKKKKDTSTTPRSFLSVQNIQSKKDTWQ